MAPASCRGQCVVEIVVILLIFLALTVKLVELIDLSRNYFNNSTISREVR